MTPQEQLAQVADEAAAAVHGAATLAALEIVETDYLGRKSGKLTGLLRLVGALPADEKPAYGQAVNARKDALTARAVREAGHAGRRRAHIARLAADAVDVTLPGTPQRLGNLHPLTRQMQAVKDALISMGYSFAEYPDIEDYHYNFETLNYPPDHPAFDEQMSFYIDDRHLLRTQTTAFQAHVMEGTLSPPSAPPRWANATATRLLTPRTRTRSTRWTSWPWTRA